MNNRRGDDKFEKTPVRTQGFSKQIRKMTKYKKAFDTKNI